jgi:transposase-like protein
VEDYPKTMTELHERFGTEEACLGYLARLRWPNGFACPRCGHAKAWPSQRGLQVCRKCEYQTSVTAGTIFQDTHKPLRQWFEAMWHVTNQKHGVSALGLQRALGLGSYHTAWTWLHKLRRAMVRPGRDRLSGLIEVDEVFIGGEQSGKTGRGARGKTLVLVAAQEAAERRIGRIRLLRIADAAMETLHEAIQECIEPDSTVRTDAWGGYNNLDMIGYERVVVRKDATVGKDTLPLVNRVASLLKRWLLGTHQGAVRPSHLDYYLDEFTFRFNRRTSRSRGMLFYRLAQQAVAVGPWTENEIRGGFSAN